VGEGRYMNIRHDLPDLGFIPTLSQTQLLLLVARSNKRCGEICGRVRSMSEDEE